MIYLNKLLHKIKENPTIFKSPEIIKILGITPTQIKDLKKFALEKSFIEQRKQEFFLTNSGEEYLNENPLTSWATSEYPNRPEVNVEYLKLEKAPAVLTKAMRNLAKHLINGEELKAYSLEKALFEDLASCKKLSEKIEKDILSGKQVKLEKITEKYLKEGLTNSLISIIILSVLVKNIDKIAIYEKSMFQLKFDTLMFDRIFACPQNFEFKKTEMPDEFILKDISKIILNKKSNNILEITKGLYYLIKTLDKYTMNTQNLSKKTIRLRNVIVNAKDPINLFNRDIPKALGNNSLQECDREFLNDLKTSLNELKNTTASLTKELKKFLFESFHTKSKENLAEGFLKIRYYIGDKELKTLLNTVIDTNVNDDLWINRIATVINKSRVPKDWSDEDYADFKVKTKELALKFFVLEATVGTDESSITPQYHYVLNNLLNLSKHEQLILLRKMVNL